MLDRDLDHGAEVVVVLAADGAVAGVDAVLGEGFGAVGIFGEELVAVVVEVADDGRVPPLGLDAIDDVGDGFGGVVVVDGDADELRAGAGEGGDLLDGAFDVGGVGVGHRLHDDGSFGADTDAAYVDGDRFSAINSGHGKVNFTIRNILALCDIQSDMRSIALEEHFVTKSFLNATGADSGSHHPFLVQLQPKLLDIGEGRIAAMDESGIDFQVLSLARWASMHLTRIRQRRSHGR